MAFAWTVAWVTLVALGQDPGPAPAAPGAPADLAVPTPPPPPRGSGDPAPAAPSRTEAAPAPSPLAIPAGEAPRASRPLEDRPEAGPNLGSFLVGSFAVVGCLGGAFLLLRRLARRSRRPGSAGAIKILARKAVGARQEVLLLEVGPKVFLVGSARDHLSWLGEFGSPDDVAALRASLPDRRDASLTSEFSQSLREGLREEEAPREDRVFASIADELAEIRRTVRAWRA